MKRIWIALWTITTLICVLAASPTSIRTSAQTDNPEPTISALETEVAKYKATSAARGEKINAQRTEIAELRSGEESSVASEETPTAAPRTESEVDSPLFGPGPASLPDGDPGIVAIVAMGEPIDNEVPLAVRNNTGADVILGNIVGVVRDRDGSLLGSTSYASLAPHVLPAGQVGVGMVILDVDELAAGLTYELEVEYDDFPSDFDYMADLEITEAELTDDGIVGIARNPLSEEINLGSVTGVCFGGEGEIVGVLSGSTDKLEIPAGKTTSFSARFDYPGRSFSDAKSAAETCSSYLLGISGFAT